MDRLTLALAPVLWALFFVGGALAADKDQRVLHVLSSNASRPAISELVPRFEESFKATVKVQYANNPILKQQIDAGAQFDIVIIEPQMLQELAKTGFVAEDSVVALATIGMALVSREGAPAVDIRTVDSFRKVLLAAKSIAYTADGHSGAVFLRTLERLDLAEEMKHKLMPIVGRLSTVAVADGSAQYTAFPLAGSVPGVQMAGQFPAEIQTFIGISAAVSRQSAAPALSRDFLEYLQSVSARTMFGSKGYTVPRAGQE